MCTGQKIGTVRPGPLIPVLFEAWRGPPNTRAGSGRHVADQGEIWQGGGPLLGAKFHLGQLSKPQKL